MPIVGERERRIASNTVLAVLAVLAACIPDVQLKDKVSAASVSGGGGGGAPSSECVARALAEWRFDSGLQEGLGATLADLDGDGFADAAIAYQLSQKTQILWGASTPAAVVETVVVSTRPKGFVAHGDLNDDGLQDLVVPSVDNGWLTVMLQKSKRVFSTTIVQEPNTGRVVLVDANDDGLVDLLIGTADCYVLRPGKGTGGIGAADTGGGCYVGLPQAAEVHGGNFDGPGVSKSKVAIRDDGKWKLATLSLTGPKDEEPIGLGLIDGAEVLQWEVADLDGDGRAEVAVYAKRPTGELFLATHGQTSPRSFDTCIATALPPSATDTERKHLALRAVGDVNRDNKPDLLFGSTFSFGATNNFFMVSVP